MANIRNLQNLYGLTLHPCCINTIGKCKTTLIGTTLAQALGSSSPIVKILTGTDSHSPFDILNSDWSAFIVALKTLDKRKKLRLAEYAAQEAREHPDIGLQYQFWTTLNTIFHTAFER